MLHTQQTPLVYTKHNGLRTPSYRWLWSSPTFWLWLWLSALARTLGFGSWLLALWLWLCELSTVRSTSKWLSQQLSALQFSARPPSDSKKSLSRLPCLVNWALWLSWGILPALWLPQSFLCVKSFLCGSAASSAPCLLTWPSGSVALWLFLHYKCIIVYKTPTCSVAQWSGAVTKESGPSFRQNPQME